MMEKNVRNVDEEVKVWYPEGYEGEDGEVVESMIDEMVDSTVIETGEQDEARYFNGDMAGGGRIPGDEAASSASTVMSVSNFGSFEFLENIDTGVVIAVPVASLVITLLVFILVVEKKKAPKNGFMRWLREFLNFRSILISGIIKFVYLFSATLLTISSFVIMTQGGEDSMLEAILVGLVVLVLGNILLRIMMEMTMIMVGLWKNTSDIRAVLVRSDEEQDASRDSKSSGASKEFRDSGGAQEPKDAEKLQEQEPVEQPQVVGEEMREVRETQMVQEVQEMQETKEVRGMQDAQGAHAMRETRMARAAQAPRAPQEKQAPRATQTTQVIQEDILEELRNEAS